MEWRAITGYENYYEVSDIGTVRSIDRVVTNTKGVQRKLSGSDMKLSESKNKLRGGDGYYVVNLRKNGTCNVSPVHRLVAQAFLHNPDNLPTVNHKNGDKHDNRVCNLEWASYSENNFHALKNNLRKPRGTIIVQKDLNDEVIAKYPSVSEASRQTGISRGMISHCVNGRALIAGGYKWEKVLNGVETIPIGSTADDELRPEALEQLLFS